MRPLQRFVTLTLLAGLLLVSCGELTQTPPSDVEVTQTPGDELTPIDLQVGYGVRGSWFELYFTDPSNPFSSQGTGGVDSLLVEAIDAARLSIDVAAYSISLNSVRFALIRAHDRGVTVRVVMESTNMDRSDPQALIAAGIPVIGDGQQGLMHNKFIVIDRSEVWLGSMNFTDSGAYDDNNNMIRIKSAKIAEDYSQEFKEMFENDSFGPNIDPQTPNPTVEVKGTRVDVYFSPDDGVLNALGTLLTQAEDSIYFLAFSFTSNELGTVIRQKNEAGLDVKGVMDEEQIASNTGTEFDPFRQKGVDVLIDGIDGQMHHKVFIVDEKIVAFGSYNFSRSAEESNDENLIIIYNAEIAGQFVQEFERIRSQAHQ
ncbi:MAG: DUF1669 domain-containing protein [Chloroflexi bacterium]|nr:DUF1669 domain-containing protein [Chloroflexota bacterium]